MITVVVIGEMPFSDLAGIGLNRLCHKAADICKVPGELWHGTQILSEDVADDKCLSVRQPCRIIRFYVKGASSEWCSDDPEVFALLAKLGIKPTPAEES